MTKSHKRKLIADSSDAAKPLTARGDVTKLGTQSGDMRDRHVGETLQMRVMTWKRLREFAEAHPHALVPLKVWRKLIEAHSFETPADVKQVFGTTVDFLPNGVVVFDIGGNKFRLSVNIRYHHGRVYVREVMTHDEYGHRTRKGTL